MAQRLVAVGGMVGRPCVRVGLRGIAFLLVGLGWSLRGNGGRRKGLALVLLLVVVLVIVVVELELEVGWTARMWRVLQMD